MSFLLLQPTCVVLVAWEGSVKLADHAIRTHDGLILEGVNPLVPRKIRPLVL